jgi:hypothetical protein
MVKAKKPSGMANTTERPCTSKSEYHDICVVENPKRPDTYLARCKHCRRYLSRRNNA